MNCDDPPNLAWTQQDLYIPQPTIHRILWGSSNLNNIYPDTQVKVLYIYISNSTVLV